MIENKRFFALFFFLFGSNGLDKGILLRGMSVFVSEISEVTYDTHSMLMSELGANLSACHVQ